jgi:hypothetical protein
MTDHRKLTTLGTSPSHSHSHEHDDHEDEEEIPLFRPAFVFDAHSLDEEVPAPFDAVKITLDGTLKADLKWEKERAAAMSYIAKGIRIFWEIDLGLFLKLKYPLNNASQFLSLSLSLDHFRDTLWKEFRDHTAGVCLYRGSADFSIGYQWSEEQEANLQGWLKEQGLERKSSKETESRLLSLFCRDAAGEFLEMLAGPLPDALNRFVLLDVSGVEDPLLAAQLVTKERFSHIFVGVKGSQMIGGEISWDGLPLSAGVISRLLEKATIGERASIGVCLPPMNRGIVSANQGLSEGMRKLQQKSLAFRVIPENFLTADWDGLDYLLVASADLTIQGKRKLNGFCAAGGVVVTIGDLIGLPEEISFAEWNKVD